MELFLLKIVISNRKDNMDILNAYNSLIEILRKDCQKRKPKGIGGMWTSDGEEDNGDLIHRTYAGGYQHQLCSRKFNFEIIERYTNADGTIAELKRGSENDIMKSLIHYDIQVE